MKEFSIHRKNSLQDYLSSRPFALLIFRTGVLVCIFILLDRWILTVTALPASSYFQPLLATELLNNLFASPSKAILSSLILGFMIFRFKHFWISWSYLHTGQPIRLFILFLAALLCWWYVTYDYNLYVDQAHYYDRFIVITLLALIAWRPFFILPFLLFLTMLIWQFSVPLENSYSFAQPSMPLRMLTMFVAMMFYSSFVALLTGDETSKPEVNEWLFLSLCILAAHYWAPGIGKIVLVWFTYGHIFYLLPSTYANGWLAFLTPEQISSFAQTLAKFDGLIVITTLVLQLCSLFLLWKRSTLFALLACWTLFHIGIFATSGIFFWQWILIELAIVVLIRNLSKKTWKKEGSIDTHSSMPFINRNHFMLSIFLIGTSIFWVDPVRLAWYDTPISYTFRFEAIGEIGKEGEGSKDGQKYTLPPRFFTPYDYVFTLGKFEYLTLDPRLSIIWGSTGNRETADQLLQAKTKADIFRLEKEIGQSYHNQEKSKVFDQFIRQFILNANKRGSKSTIFNNIQAPRQLWTFAKQSETETETKSTAEYSFQEPISSINVYQVTSWFDGKAYHEIESKRVRQIVTGELL